MLLLTVIFVLGVMDTFSTVTVMNDPGLSARESNGLYSFIYTDAGMWTFIILKFGITIGIALVAFLVQYLIKELRILYACMSIGLIVVGTFVTSSNLAIAMGGSNITLFDMDPMQLSLFCLVAFLFIGLALTTLSFISFEFKEREPRGSFYRDQFGMWLPYDEK
jgi:hypothetical protein